MTDELKKHDAGELLQAVKTLNIKRAKELLEQGADPNEKEQHGDTCLKIAVIKKSTQMMELLLDKGADPDAPGTNGMTPLIQAILMRDLDLIRLLLERGASTDGKEKGRSSAIDWARYLGQYTDVRDVLKLLSQGPELRRQYLEIKAAEEAKRKKAEDAHTSATTNQNRVRSARPPSTVKKRPTV